MFKNISTILKPHQYYQIGIAICASIVLISDGMQYSWSSPVIPILRTNSTPVEITKSDEPWLESMYLLAGIAGLPISSIIVNKIGRKHTILAACVSSLIAWVFIGVADNKIYLYIGRFIAGATSDVLFVVVPMYISEIADKEIRGFLTTFIYLMMVIGIIITYSVTPFVPFYVPSIIAIALVSYQLLTFSFMPKSPYYLLIKKKYDSADTVLKKLRGKPDCSNELQEIENTLGNKNETQNFFSIVLKKSTAKAIAYVTILGVSQHFCGYSVILTNLHTILQKANSVYLSPNATGILFASIKLIAVITSSFIVDRYGRKFLLVCSSAVTAIAILGLGIYFHLEKLDFDQEAISWLPVVLVMVYAGAYDLGLGVVPKVITSELFSTQFKAIGMTYSDFVYVTMGSLSILFYNYLLNFYEMYVPFYIFSGVSFVIIFLVAFVLPETKGLSLQEIQEKLET